MTLPMCCWLAECLARWQKKGDAGWLAHWQKTDNRTEMPFSIFLSSKECVELLELLMEPTWTQITAVCTPSALDYQLINKKNCFWSRGQSSRCQSFPLQFCNFLSSYTENLLKKVPKTEMLAFFLPFSSLFPFFSFAVLFIPFVYSVLTSTSCYSPSRLSQPPLSPLLLGVCIFV